MMGSPLCRCVEQAQPGWSVVTPEFGFGEGDNGDNPELRLCRMPVIAWFFQVHLRHIEGIGELPDEFVTVTPVLCTGSVEDVQDYALQFGDRPPFYTYGCDYDDEAALLAYFREEAERRLRTIRKPASSGNISSVRPR